MRSLAREKKEQAEHFRGFSKRRLKGELQPSSASSEAVNFSPWKPPTWGWGTGPALSLSHTNTWRIAQLVLSLDPRIPAGPLSPSRSDTFSRLFADLGVCWRDWLPFYLLHPCLCHLKEEACLASRFAFGVISSYSRGGGVVSPRRWNCFSRQAGASGPILRKG